MLDSRCYALISLRCDHWCPQLWLVTHYMEQGSLFDFLSRESLGGSQAVGLCLDIATG